jgi:hypothetical protein
VVCAPSGAGLLHHDGSWERVGEVDVRGDLR